MGNYSHCSCGSRYAASLTRCPHCGAENSDGPWLSFFLGGLLGLPMGLIAWSLCSEWEIFPDDIAFFPGIGVFIVTWFAFTQLLHLIFRKGAARTAMRCEHTKFDGCYCADCGKANPETHESHDWDGCKCKRCGRVRDEGHQWYRGMHYIYEGGLSTSESYLYCEEVSYVAGEEPDDHETCRVCGKTRELK